MEDIEYGKDCAFTFKDQTKISKVFPDIENWKIKNIKFEERVEKVVKSKIYKEIQEKAKEFIEIQRISNKEMTK